MGGVNQEFSGRLAESPLTQQSQGRVHHRSSHVFRTSCASGKLLLLPPDKGFGMWVSFGAHGCVLLGTEGSGGKSGKEPARMELLPQGWHLWITRAVLNFSIHMVVP